MLSRDRKLSQMDDRWFSGSVFELLSCSSKLFCRSMVERAPGGSRKRGLLVSIGLPDRVDERKYGPDKGTALISIRYLEVRSRNHIAVEGMGFTNIPHLIPR